MKTQRAILITLFLLSAIRPLPGTEIYFGQDVSPYKPVSQGGPADVPLPIYTNSQRVASEFLARLLDPATASFEGLTTGTKPPSVALGTNTAALTGANYFVFTTTFTAGSNIVGGGFATTGTNSIGLQANGSLKATFASSQTAFGFYATDIEDNQFEVRLYHTNTTLSIIPVGVTIPQGSGGVLYFGVIDLESPFTAVEFRNIGSISETFTLDDWTVGTAIPLPHADIRVSQVEICWNSSIDAAYKVQYRSDLTANVWTDLFPTNIVATASETCVFDDIPRGRPQRYYQVIPAR